MEKAKAGEKLEVRALVWTPLYLYILGIAYIYTSLLLG